jgi:hypothetical protein
MGGRALHVPDLLSDPSRPGATIAHVDLSEPELPEPQFPELQFPELKLPTLEFSSPLANPEEIPDLPPRSDGLGVADFNRQDVVSCPRDAFAHLQAAVSLAEPERCRSYVTAEVGQAVQREVGH